MLLYETYNKSQPSSLFRVPAEQVVKDIRRGTRRHFPAEDKARIALDGCAADEHKQLIHASGNLTRSSADTYAYDGDKLID